MPTALFIPDEHNCCYRYSYSGALQTPAALPQLIIQCSIRTNYLHAHKQTHTHTHTHTLLATFGPHRPPSKYFLYLSEQWWAATGRQSWRAHLPHRSACQQALTHTIVSYITTEPVPSRLQIITHIIVWGVRTTWIITAGCLGQVQRVHGQH